MLLLLVAPFSVEDTWIRGLRFMPLGFLAMELRVSLRLGSGLGLGLGTNLVARESIIGGKKKQLLFVGICRIRV